MPEQLTLPIERDCDELRSYSELSPEAQERAIERWRDRIGELWDSNDSDQITELLVNDLEYEYGIEVSTHTEKGLRGKTYNVPDIEWQLSYCQGDGVQFKAYLDIDKLIAHGVPGCEYYTENAKRLGELWQVAQVLEAADGDEWDWMFSMDHSGGHVRMGSSFIDNGFSDEACQTLDQLEKLIADVLTAIYEDACTRLEEIGYAEIEFKSSDEYIADMLENNPQFLFDEEGEPE